MKRVLEMLKEDGVYSLTRVLPAAGYLCFLVVSVAMILTDRTWPHYGEFCAATGSAVMVQLGNKYINSRYNTPPGAAGKAVEGARRRDPEDAG